MESIFGFLKKNIPFIRFPFRSKNKVENEVGSVLTPLNLRKYTTII
ncbi:hypothetical protein MWJ95_02345 [Lysinibacillus sp. Bpr_S20]|nr:hypothetical protein [Lysinibacillus sp. BPa_S21]MCL1699248.1 hypothetical protein [Lysinibacillus sp. Bpr_S20]